MRSKDLWREYFHFSRKDRIALGSLLLILAGILLLPQLFPVRAIPPVPLKTTPEVTITGAGKDRPGPEPERSFEEATRKSSFYFDPNTIDEAGWKKLGLAARTIRTILHYRSKGGRFRKPEDLGRIYGFPEQELRRLIPFVRLPVAATTTFKAPEKVSGPVMPVRLSPSPSRVHREIDINEADSSAWESLPGIGAKLSMRIIHFREKLGGFYSVDQIAETFGLADSVFQNIRQFLRLKASSVKKININSATLEDLKTHPYIRWNIANALVAYRKEHGPFTVLEDLKKIQLITNDLYERLRHYLVLE